MAEATTDEEPDRGATGDAAASGGNRGGGVALADEGPDELPALLAFAVGIAILTIGLIWPTISDDHTGVVATDEVAADADQDTADATEDDEAEPEEEAEEPEEEEAAPALPDLPAIQALLDGEVPGLGADGDGNTVVLTGEVPDEATRDALIAQVEGQPNVDAVDATGLVVAAGAEAAVDVTAAQVSIVLSGTVPDEATRDAIVSRAVAVYSEEQVDDQLVVDAAATPPATVTIGGSMTDPVLYNQVVEAFADLDGVELGDTSGFTLEESSDLEAALNSLEPIQFASGSAIVQGESAPILDEAAELLNENPDVALEIGGHTDSIGGDEGNQTLSEARAQAVLAELRARGVENDLTAVGFGERRLKVSPDENDPEAQQENRRIEFRIV
ncbi:MAG: OmpA family protein [Actinomycetota bacterium]